MMRVARVRMRRLQPLQHRRPAVTAVAAIIIIMAPAVMRTTTSSSSRCSVGSSSGSGGGVVVIAMIRVRRRTPCTSSWRRPRSHRVHPPSRITTTSSSRCGSGGIEHALTMTMIVAATARSAAQGNICVGIQCGGHERRGREGLLLLQVVVVVVAAATDGFRKSLPTMLLLIIAASTTILSNSIGVTKGTIIIVTTTTTAAASAAIVSVASRAFPSALTPAAGVRTALQLQP
mmetsp:Transcript_1276/g.2100  ORF Transcript_1276/g.2100 Transcript_1276/m.2100 type:complete len:232 (+) Transcript_1276:271-966(+)